MHAFLTRSLETTVKEYLEIFPAVVLLGSRQCGKYTLIKMMSGDIDNILFLDLQNMDDLRKLEEPSLFFEVNEERVICLDEIQMKPDLFAILRSVIDKNRRKGHFILLGSASRNLVQSTSESLAGRAGILELTPFLIQEIVHSKSRENLCN